MAAFDLLHPGLQHHIVNSLGWRDLRPFQEQALPTILQGDHVLIVAPTAGGKTEAASLPILSRMLTEDWKGMSVLYLCPIKALLNNLHDRLSKYATLVGRTCAVWHGDVSPAQRSRIIQNPPDILLTTPESLEVMLVSQKTDASSLFAQTRAVIIDELHAFAGDDRGWHMLSVLERISHIAGRELQRIGLSATVGNPDQLLAWLTAGRTAPQQIICPSQPPSIQSDVQLDFVGSLNNAAIVISRLHRGEKRLVFVDSRAKAEELSAALTNLEIKTFVTHSSLSKDQRSRAELAFATQTDCVIVATSVLELGVDIGDLDRVIQINAPSTVASFLQRMGRTGRRSDTKRNCLFLATHDDGLLQSAALLDLWNQGYIEEINPPAIPYHVFMQQLFTLVLQSADFVRSDWPGWIGNVPAFAELSDGRADVIINHALEQGYLAQDGGVLHMGPEAEKKLGRRHYSSLLSVITSPPLFQVRFGRVDIGFVHPLSFMANENRPTILALSGRSWSIVHLDWNRKIAHVQPAQDKGRSRWMGSSVPLSAKVCGAIKDILQSTTSSSAWSRRATQRINELKVELADGVSDGPVLVRKDKTLEWWTFAGLIANQTVVQFLQPHFDETLRATNLWINLPADFSLQQFHAVITQARSEESTFVWDIKTSAVDMLKFSDLLPSQLLQELILERIADIHGARKIIHSEIREIQSLTS